MVVKNEKPGELNKLKGELNRVSGLFNPIHKFGYF
jgi:hypothetical protein